MNNPESQTGSDDKEPNGRIPKLSEQPIVFDTPEEAVIWCARNRHSGRFTEVLMRYQHLAFDFVRLLRNEPDVWAAREWLQTYFPNMRNAVEIVEREKTGEGE